MDRAHVKTQGLVWCTDRTPRASKARSPIRSPQTATCLRRFRRSASFMPDETIGGEDPWRVFLRADVHA